MMSRKTMSAAIAMAQREEMLRDESVYIMGLDVGPYGGAFGCTRGLWQEFGRERVMDMPISEAGYVGAAVGSAMTNMRPIAELQFTDWITIASDMLVNQAANMRYTFGGSLSVPMVLRAPVGGYMAAASQHSHMFESWFSFIPVAEEALEYLDAPILRIGALDAPNPFSAKLERYILPSVERIVREIREMF